MKRACQILEVPRATWYRWNHPSINVIDPHSHSRPKGPAGLSTQEIQEILDILHSSRFVDKSPRQVYASLLDEGRYICSPRTMYRILGKHGEVQERRNQLRRPNYKKPILLATGPNQVWSWDITKLHGPEKWVYYYLYVILDIYSRYVVGWMLADRECSELAQTLIQTTVERQKIDGNTLTLHSDRGASMTSLGVAELLIRLEIKKSLNRPYCSNDNPFSESGFKTMKYVPTFPEKFGSLEHGKEFCGEFFPWYNNEHYHSGLEFLTPKQVHMGEVEAVVAKRQAVLDQAYKRTPGRFSRRPIQRIPKREVWINKPESS